LLDCFVHRFLYPFELFHHFLGWLLFLGQHGAEVHTTRNSDVDAEFVFDAALGRVLLASIDATTIGSLVLLFKTLDTEDCLIVFSIGPDSVSRIGGQVLEALHPCDFRRHFTKNVQFAEHFVLFRT